MTRFVFASLLTLALACSSQQVPVPAVDNEAAGTADDAPPSCSPRGTACESRADCCNPNDVCGYGDGVCYAHCIDSTISARESLTACDAGQPMCSPRGAMCNSNADCCNPNDVCSDGDGVSYPHCVSSTI